MLNNLGALLAVATIGDGITRGHLNGVCLQICHQQLQRFLGKYPPGDVPLNHVPAHALVTADRALGGFQGGTAQCVQGKAGRSGAQAVPHGKTNIGDLVGGPPVLLAEAHPYGKTFGAFQHFTANLPAQGIVQGGRSVGQLQVGQSQALFVQVENHLGSASDQAGIGVNNIGHLFHAPAQLLSQFLQYPQVGTIDLHLKRGVYRRSLVDTAHDDSGLRVIPVQFQL